jgi:hypothetical protein
VEITIVVSEDSGRSLDRVRGMAEPNLTESAWQKAKEDAAGIYRTTTFQLGGALLAAIFSALAVIAQEGQPASTQAAVLVLAAAVAILLSVVVVLVCQLAAAPVRQRNLLRESWSEPKKIVNVDLTLRDAYRKGNELAKRLEQRTAWTRTDRSESEDWIDSVVPLLAGNVPDDATREFLATGGGESSFVRRLRQQVTALQNIIDGLG